MSNSPDPLPEKLAPFSQEAEEAVLGSILINSNCLKDLLPWLKSADFFIVRHAWVYEAILTLHERGEDIDNLTVIDVLRDREQLDPVGGSAFITYLINYTPTHIHAYTYGRIVESTARRRRLLATASAIAQSSLDTGFVDKGALEELIQNAQSLLTSAADDTDDLSKYLIHASELENLPPVTWLIPGELPERGLTMYFGPSGVGKSFIALNQALALSENIPVVYIAAEGEYGFAARVAAWCRHNKKDPKNLKIYFFMNVLSIVDEKERQAFVKLIERIAPRLIVVDTVAHCMLPGNENDTRDMGLFIKGLKAMQKKFECTALLVHHTNKGGQVARGNGSLANACDVIARITDDDDLIRFECIKSKDAQPFATRHLRLLPVELKKYPSTPVIIAAEKAPQTKSDPLSRQQQKLLDILSMEAYENGLNRAELVELTELSAGSVGRILSALKRFGYVEQTHRGERYTLKAHGQTKDSQDSHGSFFPVPGKAHQQTKDSQDSHGSSDSRTDRSGPVSHASHASLHPTNWTDKDRFSDAESDESISEAEADSDSENSSPGENGHQRPLLPGWEDSKDYYDEGL